MSMPDKGSRYKRTNLFLLRVWCDEEYENEQGDECSGPRWRGMVQRTVSGEAHSFEGRDDLLEVLANMLYKERSEQRRLRENTNSVVGLPAGAATQTEANEGTR